MSQPLDILKQYWGYSLFRPLQEDIIQSVLDNKDTLALLPTGGGKSICFQVPGLILEGVCIVISPLIALMKDQVENLKKKEIKATAIYSGMNYREIDITLDNCIYGNQKFLYLSPERLKSDLLKERIKKMKVGLFVVDEAHCISQWGYDFRPSYLEIAEIRELHPEIPVLALTATATDFVKKDIQEKLHFKTENLFQKSFARSNLSYSCFYEDNKEKKLVQILNSVKGTAIIYSRNRKNTQRLSEFLVNKGISCDYYHAGLDHITRSRVQEQWLSGAKRVMVATNAFGMGIDKPDVRVVVHLDLPDNPEAYYQEAGRAGRDEKTAYAVIIYNNNDLDDLLKRSTVSYPDLVLIKNVYQQLANSYQIAIGDGQGLSFDFSFNEFCKTYKLPPLETWNCLHILEKDSIITLSDAFDNPSRLMILNSGEKIYKFMVENSKYEPIIKALLRLYGGELYTGYGKISEIDLAKYLKIDIQTVTGDLNHLNKIKLIDYMAQNNKPQITFLTERFDSKNLPLDILKLKQLKTRAEEKAHAMANYIKDTKRCRTALLLEYFSEKTINDCGVCDNCINAIKKKKEMEMTDQIEKKVKEKLTEKSYELNTLVSQIDKINEKMVLEVIRMLLDKGLIKYDESNNIVLVDKYKSNF